MGVGDGAQDDGVEDAEHRRVHTDAERQRQDYDCREPGTSTECADRVARVLQQLIDPQRDSHNRHPSSRSRYCVELEHSLTAGATFPKVKTPFEEKSTRTPPTTSSSSHHHAETPPPRALIDPIYDFGNGVSCHSSVPRCPAN